MQRIDGPYNVSTLPAPAPAANSPGYFWGGDPGRGQKATRVTQGWLNMVQEEICNVIGAAEITLERTEYDQLLRAIRQLIAAAGGGGGGGGGSGGGANPFVYPGAFYSFYEQSPPEGWRVRNGAILPLADTAFPRLWEALLLPANAWKCVSEDQWQTLSTAAGKVGGVPKFVVDVNAKTIRLPDTRNDYERCAGGDDKEKVGEWHADAIRNITGTFELCMQGSGTGAFSSAVIYNAPVSGGGWVPFTQKTFDASKVVPTAAENRTRAFRVLGCVYVGDAS